MNNSITFSQIAVKIIRDQEAIIGPLAWMQAKKVSGLQIIDEKTGTVTINDANGSLIIDSLVGQYDRLFGRASREVCKEAAAPFLKDLTVSEIPVSLQ